MSSIDSIDLHVRSYRSALKSSLEVAVNSFSNYHLKMDSILHPFGSDPQIIDFSSLIYCLLRLPSTIDRTKLVLMGQNPSVFIEAGFPDITTWQKVFSPARRRTRFFDPKTSVSASLISSITDVDDIVNLLIAYQIEWNKFHSLLHLHYPTSDSFDTALTSKQILNDLKISPDDWQKFTTALGEDYSDRLHLIYTRPQDLRLRLLAGSWIDYTKTVQSWLKNITSSLPEDIHLSQSEIYFVSSNTHSLLNLFTSFPLQIKDQLSTTLTKPPLLPENDFYYYLYRQSQDLPKFQQAFSALQQQLGIITIPPSNYLDIKVQIFPISSIAKHCDPRLIITKPQKLESSPAFIVNIDYPLGFAAYHILNELLENVKRLKGVYILGKAAVLNSEIGDVEIPRIVFDEHTQNTYLFNNCFNSFFPFPNQQGSILTNQKAVSVLGTFLENEALLQKYSENNITTIEMESGPYLSALTEATYDQQLPRNTIIDLNQAPLDLGIINYTSDTPYSQAKNLGAGSLDLNGIEPVYLGTLAILQRIINLEEQS